MKIISKSCLVALIFFVFIRGAIFANEKTPAKSGSDIIEWSFISALALSNIFLEKSPVWTNNTLIPGTTNKEYHKDTVASGWIYLAGGLGFAGVLLLPNDQGWLNQVSYENTKGYAEALMLTVFVTDITKNSAARKRPSYDNYPEDELKDARKSFFSGHASVSFSVATYGSLFIFQHLGKNDDYGSFAWKGMAALGLFGLAGFVSWSRVKDNKHHVSDVVIGGIVGFTISALIYPLHNNFFPWKKTSAKKNEVAFDFMADGSSFSGRALMRF